MKKTINILLYLVSSVFFIAGCESNEKFTGSPVDNMEIITLDATVSSSKTFALTDQKIDFTVTLPRTFSDTTTVEVSSLSNSGRRTRAYVDIMPNQTSGTETIKAAGSGLYNGSFDLFVSAINLQTVESGKHFLIKSNTVNILSGNTTIPDPDSEKLKIKFIWPNIVSANNLNNLSLVVDRPGSAPNANVNSFNEQAKFHFINNSITGTNNATNSYAEGDYQLSVKPILLQNTPSDFPYRFVIVHPDGKEEVFQGTFIGMTLNTTTPPILNINKTISTTTGKALYTVTQL